MKRRQKSQKRKRRQSRHATRRAQRKYPNKTLTHFIQRAYKMFGGSEPTSAPASALPPAPAPPVLDGGGGFTPEKCSPASPTASDDLKFTCYDEDTLRKMRDLWNARHSDSKITSDSPREIWTELKKNMSNTCDRESCWVKSKLLGPEISKKIVDEVFAPQAPEEWNKNIDEWLSSVDIVRLMSQFERQYPDFDFMGPSPIDYDTHTFNGDCVWEELCEFSLKEQIKRNKTKIGVIFNTDPHYKGGQHWVALFVHIPRREIVYFDSYGEPPEKQFQKFMDTVSEQGKEMGIHFKQIVNKIRHQYSDGQCGMYSLHIIIELLKDRKPQELIGRKISDDHMRRLRKKYFNNVKS